MELIVVGGEYTGKTTLINNIVPWIGRTMGGGRGAHDHFVIPPAEMTLEDQEYYMKASPKFKESFQRYVMEYHLHQSFYRDPDHLLADFHIGEAVYAPLYYGYGGPGQYADRELCAREIEEAIMKAAPDTVLVLLKAAPQVIARRMNETPHPHAVVQEKDIEYVVGKFEDQYERSLIKSKFTVDTGTATIEESLSEFVSKYEPLLTDADRMRILVHKARQRGEWV